MASSKDPSFLIVGIGASAGGLAVIKALFQAIPKETRLAFVVIQHLDPTHKSLMSELVAKVSSIPVTDARNNHTIEPGNAYIIPPNSCLTVNEGRLKLRKPDHIHGSRNAIDHFFCSLAIDCGNRCAGVILSGTGSDGTAGLKAIKTAGGLCIAQNPSSAEHHAMPTNAIQAGVVDNIADVSLIPELLERYSRHPFFQHENVLDTQIANPTSIEEIKDLLDSHESFNARRYKSTTMKRRITRRMSLLNYLDYDSYLERLKVDQNERQLLTNDLLINVTDFFRDKEAFDLLEKKVLTNIIENIGQDEEIRVWVAGCASGEEAYTIAILLYEALEKANCNNTITLFATDIDSNAIKCARKGRYPRSIEDHIPKRFLEKYFVRLEKSDEYRVNSILRDAISFAVQDVVSDPPFNHMHLVTCRNLLIYLKRSAQEKVLGSFYFSLKDDAHLFLGSSESLGDKANSYRTVSKKWRIYQKSPGQNQKNKRSFINLLMSERDTRPAYNETVRLHALNRKVKPTRAESMRDALLNTFLPPTVVVDEHGQILYNHGDWKDFIQIPTGEPQQDIMQLITPSLRSRLRSAFFKVKKTREVIEFRAELANEDSGLTNKIVNVCVSLIEPQGFVDGLAIGIMFRLERNAPDNPVKVITKEDEINASLNLERELAETKEELQNTIEELETKGEELKASHEEALSTNEELQSANEELEASSEELRSLNEELSTVNAQLKEKIDQLQRVNDDIENFFASTDLPTIFLDPDLRIQRYTSAAEQLLKMGPKDIGRQISSIGRDLVDKNLVDECVSVLKNYQPVRKEIQSHDNRWFVRQITLYRTEDRRVEGVVLVFQDVTEIKNLSNRAEAREKQQSVVAQLGLMALSGADPYEVMHRAVRQVAHVLEADFSKVLRYRANTDDFELTAGFGWQEGLVGKATIDGHQNSQAGYTLGSEKPVIVEDLRTEKRFTGPTLLIEHGVVSGMSCKINHSEPSFGVLSVHTKHHRVFTEYDTHFIVSVANMLSTALKTNDTQKLITHSEEKLRIAMETSRSGAFEYSLNSEGTVWDDRLKEIWGLNKSETPTQKIFWDGVHEDDHAEVQNALDKATSPRSNGYYHSVYRVLNRQDGSVKWVEASGQTVFEAGQPIRMIGMVSDITERKILEESLQAAVLELREIDVKKNEFLSVLGHELRNPLASLSGNIDLLQLTLCDDNKTINSMKHNIQMMATLLDDLLDLNRISKNKIQLSLSTLSLNDLLEETMTSVKHHCDEKDQLLTLIAKQAVFIHADATRIEQVFSNLIINASKHTPKGGHIHVESRVLNQTVYVDISDNGIGLDEHLFEKIFEPFFQLKQEGVAAAGLGVGLALSRRLAELHGGTIEVKSEGEAKGSKFTVILPILITHSNNTNPKTSDRLQKPREGLNIVLIDDNVDLLTSLPILLSTFGCNVQTAKTGSDGLELVAEVKPDAVLIDIGLPDMTGHDVADTLRKSGYGGTLIAISGYSHKESRDKSKEVGFDHHLAKPAAINTILECLHQA